MMLHWAFLRVSYAYKVFYKKYVCLYLNFRIAEAQPLSVMWMCFLFGIYKYEWPIFKNREENCYDRM